MNIFINFFKILFQNRKNQRKTDIFVLKMSVCQQAETWQSQVVQTEIVLQNCKQFLYPAYLYERIHFH